jgi:hypothetical protein
MMGRMVYAVIQAASQIDSLHSCPILPWTVESSEEKAESDVSVCRHLLQAHTVDAPKRSAARQPINLRRHGAGAVWE